MPSHDLHDERPLMGGRGRNDAVHGLNDPVEGGVGPDGHVRAAKI